MRIRRSFCLYICVYSGCYVHYLFNLKLPYFYTSTVHIK